MRRFLLTCLLLLPLLLADAQDITKMEYFVDADPGYGNGTNIPVASGKNVSASFSINLSGLFLGVHVVVVRARQDNNLWSVISAATFITVDLGSRPDITAMEYYIDTDPGFGLASPLTITPGKDVAKSFAINLTGLQPGIHQVVVRVKDSENTWSIVSSELFFAFEPVKTPITKMEYFIDTDPGYGNATNVPVTAGFDISKSFSLNLTGLTPGIHILSLRTRDANGVWSVNSNTIFLNMDLSVANTNYLEYFTDTDPGFGNGTPLVITPGQNISTGFVIDTYGWGASSHDVFLRFRNTKGDWSLTNTVMDNCVPMNLLLQGINISETTPVCYDALQYITVAGSGTSFQVQSGTSVTMIAGQRIRIYPTTKIFSGAYFHAYISTTYCLETDAGIITGDDVLAPTDETAFFRVYPNPTTGKFTLEITDGALSDNTVTQVYSTRGELILKWEMKKMPLVDLSLETSPPGLYFVRVIRGNTASTKKIMRE
jgi:hypothetical protein